MAKLNILINSVFLFSAVLSFSAHSQADSTNLPEPSNSFEEVLAKRHPDLKYQYHPEPALHDYSGNWDFDGDGEFDKVYFVGTGGAHLYFYFAVTLSSSKTQYVYKHIELDFPLFEDISAHGTDNDCPPAQFSVGDFDSDGYDEIYFQLDTPTYITSKDILKDNHISTPCFFMHFDDRKRRHPKFTNYKPKKK